MKADRNDRQKPPGRSDRAVSPDIRARSVRPFLAAVLVAGMTLTTAHTGAAQDTAWQVAIDRYAAEIAEAARRFGLPSAWIAAVLWQESHGDPTAVSRKGARGLMQIMPATWAALTARHGLGDDPFDPRANILAGAAYLREMHDRYGDPALMLAAYNAGLGRVNDWLRRGRPLPRETRDYVAAILPRIDVETAAMPQTTDPFAAPIFVPRSTSTDRSAGGRLSGSDTTGQWPPPLFVDRSSLGERE